MLYNKGLSLFLLCCATKSGPTGASWRVAGADANWSHSVPNAHGTLFFTSPIFTSQSVYRCFHYLSHRSCLIWLP
jgi:hypothetical protein